MEDEAKRILDRFLEGRIGLILEPEEANECAKIVVEEILDFIYDLPLTEDYLKAIAKYEGMQKILNSGKLC